MFVKAVELLHSKFPTRDFYPFNLEILRATRRIALSSPVTFFVGENGSGKSTLLRAICRACGIYIWEGQEGARVDVNPYEEALHTALRVEWADGRVPGSFFGSEIFRHFAQLLDEWASLDRGQLEYFGGRSLITQSHGQSLMSFFRSRYAVKGVYFLDEPETALSPRTQMALLELLGAMSEAGHAQFIAATHSPILLSLAGAQIYSFDAAPIRPVAYRDTDHFRVYHRFMAEKMRQA